MSDLISRQAAIEIVSDERCGRNFFDPTEKAIYEVLSKVIRELFEMPSAQPEIIRCKDCKYHDEGYRRISVKWLPCMDICPGSNWYCGSAERRADEAD